MGTGVDRITGNISTACAEALAVSGALFISSSTGLSNVIIESDCRNVVDALTGKRVDDSYLGMIIDDCLQLLP